MDMFQRSSGPVRVPQRAALFIEIVCQNLRLADAVLSDQHEIMVGRGHVEELDQLGCINVDICHSA